MKRIQGKKIKSMIVSLLLVMVFSVTGFAKEDDFKNIGSIKIQLTEAGSGTSKENVRFAYTKVADVVNGKYELLERYKQANVDLNKLEHAEDLKKATEQLEKIVEKDGEIVTDKKGKAVIENLPIGVYLLTVSDRGIYDNVTSVLVSIPTFDEISESMIYDVSVTPKHTPIPPETVKTGDEKDLEKWLFFATGAMVLIAISGGWLLCKEGKK